MNIVWKRPDGGVSVTHLTNEAESPQKEAEKLKTRGDIPMDWECVCFNAELPADREFREAWSWETPEPKVDISLERARLCTKERLRRERAPQLAALDVAYMRADELGDGAEKVRIRQEKQRLRDFPMVADACLTLDELRALKL